MVNTIDAGALPRRRGRKPKYTPEERRALHSERLKAWRAKNPHKVKAQNDKTNGRLKTEWAAARAKRNPADLLKTGIGTPLSLFLAEQCIAEDCNLGDLTVMASITDPFRMDRALAHKEGRWFKEHLEIVAGTVREIHLRAVHYAFLGRSFILPNKAIYSNTNEHYMWLNNAAKSARWLGYVPFGRITDERNEAPYIYVPDETRQRAPEAWVSAYVPELSSSDLLPYVAIEGAAAPQPYRIALIAEKASARAELEPLARQYEAELLLPTGHLSDRMIFDLASRASRDGRKLICLYASDADPSGWSMPIILARKLQAHRILHFHNLRAEVHHVGLLPQQVHQFDLPDSLLGEGEKRSEAWREAFGFEQVELDALIGRHPGALAAAFENVMAAYYDPTIRDRLEEQIEDTRAGLETALQSTDEWRDAYRAVKEQYETARAAIAKIAKAQAAAKSLEFEPVDWPPVEPRIEIDAPEPLFDSQRPWVEQTRRLKSRRAFDGGGGDE